MPVSNRILGEKYQLIRPLSHGGMGSVWLAEHLSLAAPVAVKLIAPELGTSPDFRQRFLCEAHAAAALRSPHVVQTLDYGVDGDTPYIIMELLEGESLAERLGRKGALSVRETELVLRHVSRAVARAHEQGIVHRDLKPANIFITRNEDEEIIKLFDFGIAKAMSGAAGDVGDAAAQTRTGSLLGTPAYMSPEQLEGNKDCDGRVDIWAMGVIAYECLLGKPPFAGHGLGGLVQAIIFGPLPVPSEQGSVPPAFDAWFARACARRPSERFANAREAAQALRQVLTPELEGVDAEPLATIVDGPLSLAGTEPLGLSTPSEVAFPLRRRERQHTGAPASATIHGSGWRRGRVRFASALVVAIGLLLLAGYRLWQPQPGLERAGLEQLGLQGRQEDAAEGAASLPPAEGSLPERAPSEREATTPALAGALSGTGALRAPVATSASAVSRSATHGTRTPARATPSARSATASRKASATLTVTSNPSSHVLIDGVPKGSTPLHSVRVRPGNHRVTLIHGKQRKTLHVATSAGENTLLSARFSEPEVLAAQELGRSP